MQRPNPAPLATAAAVAAAAASATAASRPRLQLSPAAAPAPMTAAPTGPQAQQQPQHQQPQQQQHHQHRQHLQLQPRPVPHLAHHGRVPRAAAAAQTFVEGAPTPTPQSEDEALALRLQEEELALQWAHEATAEDFGGNLEFAAAAALASGLPPDAFLQVPGLREVFMMQQGWRHQPEDDRPAAPTEGQLRRLPTRKATGRLLEEECPVCFLSYEEGEEVRTLPCLHAFHTECIDKWLTSRRASSLTCPLCHTEVDI